MNTRKPSQEKLEAVQMMRAIGEAYSADDAALSAYFSSVDEHDIMPQRSARDDFSRRLERARTTPTVVTVRARGDNPGGTFLIIEAKMAKQMARFSEDEPARETITERMRKLRAEMDVDLPRLRIERSQRQRSSVPQIGRKATAEMGG